MKSVALILLIACGDNHAGPITAEPRSGSRLRIEQLEYEDGTRQLASSSTVFDLERGESCTIRRWSDGLRYCTPTTHLAVFADPECTHEVARVRATDPETPYALHEFFVAGESLPSRLHRFGAELADVTSAFERRDGLCIENADRVSSDRYFELADEIDRSALVHTKRIEISVDERLDAIIDTSPDGLQLPVALFDKSVGHECHLAHRGDGTIECELADVESSFRFADANCTEPAVVVPASIQPPDLTRRQHGLACDTFHPIGELRVVETSYTQSGRVCSEAPLSIGERVFALGPAVALAKIEASPRDEARRLQILALDNGFPDPTLFDRDLQQECTPSEIGNLHCFPAFDVARPVFDDDACLIPNLVVELAPRCGPAPTLAFELGKQRIRTVEEPAPQVYEITTGDRCAPALPMFDNSTFHRTGDAIPLTAFVSARRKID